MSFPPPNDSDDSDENVIRNLGPNHRAVGTAKIAKIVWPLRRKLSPSKLRVATSKKSGSPGDAWA